jgi:transposase-like protein
MDGKVAEFRKAAERRRSEGTAARYPEEMRQFALAHVKARVASGASMHSIAKELGVAGQTLSYWLHASEAKRAVGARFVPVTVRPESRMPSRAALVVVAGELRIEVADVATAIELVRGLRC